MAEKNGLIIFMRLIIHLKKYYHTRKFIAEDIARAIKANESTVSCYFTALARLGYLYKDRSRPVKWSTTPQFRRESVETIKKRVWGFRGAANREYRKRLEYHKLGKSVDRYHRIKKLQIYDEISHLANPEKPRFDYKQLCARLPANIPKSTVSSVLNKGKNLKSKLFRQIGKKGSGQWMANPKFWFEQEKRSFEPRANGEVLDPAEKGRRLVTAATKMLREALRLLYQES